MVAVYYHRGFFRTAALQKSTHRRDHFLEPCDLFSCFAWKLAIDLQMLYLETFESRFRHIVAKTYYATYPLLGKFL